VVLGVNDWVVSLDLSTTNFEELKEIFKPYLEAGRRIEDLNLIREEMRRTINPLQIRTWAVGRGIKIHRTGRIPTEIEDQYIRAEVSPNLA